MKQIKDQSASDSDVFEFEGKTYFQFTNKILCKGGKAENYVVCYEDLQMLHESLQQKDKVQLPEEEQIIKDSKLLDLYLQKIQQLVDQEEYKNFLSKQTKEQFTTFQQETICYKQQLIDSDAQNSKNPQSKSKNQLNPVSLIKQFDIKKTTTLKSNYIETCRPQKDASKLIKLQPSSEQQQQQKKQPQSQQQQQQQQQLPQQQQQQFQFQEQIQKGKNDLSQNNNTIMQSQNKVTVSLLNDKLQTNVMNIGLNKLALQEQKETLFNLLKQYGYSQIQELGAGAYGIVIKAKNPEGFSRAIKIQLCETENDEIEFQLGRLLFYEGLETLFGNSVMTYNMRIIKDSLTNKRIALIEMELAQSNLSEFLEKKINPDTDKLYEIISEEDFSDICQQLVANVLCMHNLGLVHRDIKPDNILIVDNMFVLADFGVSDTVPKQPLEKMNDTFKIKQQIGGTPLYMSPKNRNALKQKQMIIEHDPYKSDIYSLGLMILEIQLLRKGLKRNDIVEILIDEQKAYKFALENDINEFFNKGSQFLYGQKVKKLKNILAMMLEPDERERISSVRLALVCQLDKLILSRIIMPYRKIFPPQIQSKIDNSSSLKNSGQGIMQDGQIINYIVKSERYVGSVLIKNNDIRRHGKGRMEKLNCNQLIFDGSWLDDLPNGQGTFQFFQDDWVYEGRFEKGNFHGSGKIKFMNQIIYEQQFYCNIMESDLLQDVDMKQIYPQKWQILTGYNIIEIIDLPSLRIIQLDYSQLSQLGSFLKNLEREKVVHIIRLFWKSKEKEKVLFLKGENYYRIEIFYEEQPVITQTQFECMLGFIGYVEQIDISFLDFDITPYIPKLGSAISIRGLQSKKFTLHHIMQAAQTDCFRNLLVFDISNSNRFTQQLVDILESNHQKFIIRSFLINKCESDQFNTTLQHFIKTKFFTKIQELDVGETEIDDANIQLLTLNGNNLTNLNLDKCVMLTMKGLLSVNQNSSNFKQLQILNLNWLLNNVSIDDRRVATQNYKSESQFLVNFLTGICLPQLKELYLDNTKLEAQLLKEIMNCWNMKSLEVLSLKNSRNLTGFGFYILHTIDDMNQLEKIYLDGNKIEIKVETRRLIKTNIRKTYSSISFLGCQILNSEQLLRYLTIPQIQEHLQNLSIEYSVVNDQVATCIKHQTKINNLVINVDSSLLLSRIIDSIVTICTGNSNIRVQLFSKVLTPSVLKHMFIQEIQLKNIQDLDYNLIIDNQPFKEIIKEIEAPQFMNPIKLLQLPTPAYFDEQFDNGIFDDLKKLVNSVKFLNITNLNLSNFSITSEIINLICSSQYVSNLQNFDLSNSGVQDSDLVEISSSKYMQNLQEIYLNNCPKCGIVGLNSLGNMQNLKYISFKYNFINIDELIMRNEIRLVLNCIKVKAESDSEIIQKQFVQFIKPNLKHLDQFYVQSYSIPFFASISKSITEESSLRVFAVRPTQSLNISQSSQSSMPILQPPPIQTSTNQQQQQINYQELILKIKDIIDKCNKIEQISLDFSEWKKMGDSDINNLADAILKSQRLTKLDLSLKSWAFKNPKITNISLKYFFKCLSELKLDYLSLDLEKWGAWHPSLSDDCIHDLQKSLLPTNLQVLILNLDGWAIGNVRITENSIKYINMILKESQQLKIFHLNISRWGDNNTNIGDNTLIQMSYGLNYLKNIQQLYLIVEGWGIKCQKISDISIRQLCSSISQMHLLTHLDLNFQYLGAGNQFITDQSINDISCTIQKLPSLKSISLNFNKWTKKNSKITEKSVNQLISTLQHLKDPLYIEFQMDQFNYKSVNEQDIEQLDTQEQSPLKCSSYISSLKSEYLLNNV